MKIRELILIVLILIMLAIVPVSAVEKNKADCKYRFSPKQITKQGLDVEANYGVKATLEAVEKITGRKKPVKSAKETGTLKLARKQRSEKRPLSACQSAYKITQQDNIPSSQIPNRSLQKGISLTAIANATGDEICASLQDIPDGGYVRINYGVCNLESYDIFPYTCGYDSAWCQSPDRSSGIRILQFGDLYEGDLFSLEGVMSTTLEGERVVIPFDIYIWGSWFPISRPMYMSQRAATEGLAPAGLLTKISGTVVTEAVINPLDASYYYIDDGSRLDADGKGLKGIRIIDPVYNSEYNPPVVPGEIVSFPGVYSKKTDEKTGQVSPVFHCSVGNYVSPPSTGTTKYKISGKITADLDASGQVVWVGCEGGSTTAVIDSTGTAYYELTVNEGVYNVYARTPGYDSDFWCVQAIQDYVNVDYVLSPMIYYDENYDPVIEKKVLELVMEKRAISHDGVSTTKGYALLRDYEGKRWVGYSITFSATAGQIVQCDSVTNTKGKAYFVLRSSNKAETAIVTASHENLSSDIKIYFRNEGDPNNGGECNAGYNDIPDYGRVSIFGVAHQKGTDVVDWMAPYNFIWCQQPNRSQGIRIMQHWDVNPGDIFILDGTMSTTPEGERIILPDEIYSIDYAYLPRPIYMPIKALTTGLKPTIRTKISGKAVSDLIYPDMDIYGNIPPCYFLIDDGSGPLKVVCNGYEWITIGDYKSFTGQLSHETNYSTGKVNPIFYRNTDEWMTEAYTGEKTYKIKGVVAADENAFAQKVWIGCESGSTTAVFNEKGIAHFELILREGDYNIYARTPGYFTNIKVVGLYEDIGYLRFSLNPIYAHDQDGNNIEMKRVLDVATTEHIIKHDGKSETVGYVLLRDFEGKRWANEKVTISTTKGQLISCDDTTDEYGKAYFKLRSSTKGEVAVVTAISGDAISKTVVYFHNVGDPIVVILYPNDGQTVSGVTGHEIMVFDTNEDGSDGVCEHTLLLDGKAIGSFSPVQYDEEGELVRGPGFNTAQFANGPHVLSAEVKDVDGNTMISNEINLIFNNPTSELKIDKTELFYDKDTSGFNFDFVANQVPWTLRIFTIEEDNTETTVWTTSSDKTGPVHCSWDGKINGKYEPEIFMASLEAGNNVASMAISKTITQGRTTKTASIKSDSTEKAMQTSRANLYRISAKEGSKKSEIETAWKLSMVQTSKNSICTSSNAVVSPKATSQTPYTGTVWQISTSSQGEILIATVNSLFDSLDQWANYQEMRAVGNNAKKRGMKPIYVCDMRWKTEIGPDGSCIQPYGMDYWLGGLQEGGNNIRAFFLNTHGIQRRVSGGSLQIAVSFADENDVYGTDSWTSTAPFTHAFTDLQITPGKLKVTHFNVCESMGATGHKDTSIARALGCRDDLAGCTFIGWIDDYYPFGTFWHKNGIAWTKGFWYYLCHDSGASVWQARERLNASSNSLYWNGMNYRSRFYTDLEAMVTWLE